MKLKNMLSLIALSAIVIANGATPADFYPASSRMSEGKWVRVEVSESGVYGISYDKLRGMGFENPEKVGVFGIGGRQLPDQFTDRNGKPVVSSDIEPISVMHTDNSLIFYGAGVESIVPDTNSGTAFGPRYARESRNSYVNVGCYLLSDATSLEMEEAIAARSEAAELLDYGLDYWYHERDLGWNFSNTGRLFVGEDIRPSVIQSTDFQYDLPLAVCGKKVSFKGATISHPDYAPKVGYTLSGNSEKTTNVNVVEGTVTQHEYTNESLILNQNKGTMTVRPVTSSSSNEYFNLDYLLMTYQKAFPVTPSFGQERYLLTQLSAGQTGTFTTAWSAGQVVLDISDRSHPKILTAAVSDDSTASYTVTASTAPVEIMIFNTDGNLSEVSNPADVPNSNLHALAAEGADLIIITTPAMRRYAEQIAALHLEHDGITTLVADVRHIYNEFSGGLPDPTAYRSFARMVYNQGAVKPKNLLLFGPLLADSRGINADHNHDDFIIAWQDPTSPMTLYSGAYNSNEWLGNFDDFNESNTYLKKFQIGVGVLPCLSDNDASLAIRKIERFMLDESFASRANAYVACGGVGDNQMHATFSITVAGHYNRRTGKSTITYPVIADAYSTRKLAAERFNEVMAGEPMMACFFGHGNPYAFGNIYETTDVGSLRNKNLSFMIFAGCTLGRSDRGFKGIGEQMIFSTDHGLVGGLIPSRSSSAYANRDLICAVNEAIYCINPCCASDVPLIRRPEPLTIGETIALAKSACTTSAVEGAYQLVCDPALRIPFPTLDVEVTSEKITTKGNETITVSGVIQQPDSTFRENFNGEIVLRLMAPEYVCKTVNKQSHENQYTDVTYGDRTLQMSAARVKDGRFTASITVPRSIMDHMNENDSTTLYLTAFDPETRLCAAGYAGVKIDRENTGDVADSSDITPPVIERLVFNPQTNEIELTVSDDVALDMSDGSMSTSITLAIDRINQPQASNGVKVIDPDAPRYSRRISVVKLSDSEHTADLTVRDAAGNVTTAQLVFTPGDDLRPVLTADASALTREVLLTFGKNAEGAGMLLVTDASGRQAARIALADDSLSWDGTDENGQRLAPGVYTLSAVDSAGRHSDPVRLAIL